MIKLLIIFILFLLIYFCFSGLVALDSIIKFDIADYYCEISLFTFIMLMVIAIVIFLIFINVISWISSLPRIVKNFILQRSDKNQKYRLMEALVLYAINDNIKSGKIIKKLDPELLRKYEHFYKFILAESSENADLKIKIFQELEKIKLYSQFAIRRLMQMCYNEKLYDSAILYANKIYNINEYDNEANTILALSYAKQKLWKDFLFFANKKSESEKLPSEHKDDFSIEKYYAEAVKDMLKSQKHDEAIYYLESFLQLDHTNPDLLELSYSIRTSRDKYDV